MNLQHIGLVRFVLSGLSFLLLCFFMVPIIATSPLCSGSIEETKLDGEKVVQTQNNQTIQKKATNRHQRLLLSCWNPTVELVAHKQDNQAEAKLGQAQQIHQEIQVVPVGLLAPPVNTITFYN